MRIDQPSYAYVDLYIGGMNFTPLPPQYLLSFTHIRNMQDTATTFEFSVYDETALELELVIAQNPKDVLFRYGYTGGDSSPLYSGIIMDYKLEFRNGGVVLNVTGTGSIMKQQSVKRVREYSNRTIDDIIKEIAKLEGWKIGYIEPCAPLLGFYDTKSAKQTLKPFHQKNISSLDFIKKELVPYAISAKTGESDFKLYFSQTEGGNKLFFVPPRWKQRISDQYQWDYNKTGRSRIISFAPEVQGSVVMHGGGSAEALAMVSDSNEMVKVSHGDKTNKNQTKTNSKSFVAYTTGKTPMNASAGTLKELQAKASEHWYKQANQTYSASMSTIGDPSLEPNKNIEITILTTHGKPHHTSGVYLVLGITDSISGGSYTCDLELIKNAVAIGSATKGGIGK